MFARVSASAPDVVGELTLDPTKALRLWNWTLSRQGLHPAHRFDSVARIAEAGLGLHAARLASPFITVLARASGPEVALTLLGTDRPAGLITLRCMRRTLHMLPLELAAVAHAATVGYRLRDAERLAHNVGIRRDALLAADRQLTLLLADGPMAPGEIESALSGPRQSVTTVRVALRTGWERGTLTYLNQADGWNAEHRVFALTADVHPGLDLDLDPAESTRALVGAYFDRYGPATLKDVMWWSALSRTAVTSAMNSTGTEWLEVATGWSPAPGYLSRQQYEAFERADPDSYATGLNFLAPEDMALKAYAETRARYLDELPPGRAFNQIGELTPTILLDGLVKGTWAWHPADRAVIATLAGHVAPGLRREITAAAHVLTEGLRAGWGERPGPASGPPVDPDQLALTF
jgi:Winged helix DNA-binding domain